MSNIYILSNELCDFCNVPHGTRMHIKQIVRKVEDYVLGSGTIGYLSYGGVDKKYNYETWETMPASFNRHPLYGELDDAGEFVYDRIIYFNVDHNLKKIFTDISYDIKLKDIYTTFFDTYIDNLTDYITKLEKKIYKRVCIDGKYTNNINEIFNKIEKVKGCRKNWLNSEDDDEDINKYNLWYSDIDMYLEMSGHLTPALKHNINENINTVKQEITDTLNKISNKIDNVKSIVSFSNDAENELIEVNKLLKELEEMYNSK
jgi:hypothetical protein